MVQVDLKVGVKNAMVCMCGTTLDMDKDRFHLCNCSKTKPARTRRHHLLKRFLGNLLEEHGAKDVQWEPTMHSDDGTAPSRDDIADIKLTFPSTSAQPEFIDISIIHSAATSNLGGQYPTLNSALRNMEMMKHQRYEHTVESRTGRFTAFVVDYTGRLGQEARQLLLRWFPHEERRQLLGYPQLVDILQGKIGTIMAKFNASMEKEAIERTFG